MKAASPNFRQTAACAALAVAIGLGIGWLDLHANEVMVPILSLVLAGLFLGILEPAAAWRWAVLLALGLPVMQLVGLEPVAELANDFNR